MKQSDAKSSLNLHEFAWIPAAKHGLKWGMEYGPGCWKLDIGQCPEMFGSQVLGREDFSRNIRPYTRLQEHWYHLPTPNKKAMSCTFWQEWDEAFDIHTMHFVAKLVPLFDCLGSGVLAQVQAVPNEEIYNFILQEPFGQQGKMTGESCLHRSSCTRAQRKRAGRHAHVNTLRHVTVWCIYIYISPSNLRQLQFTVQISVQKNWICEDPFFQH